MLVAKPRRCYYLFIYLFNWMQVFTTHHSCILHVCQTNHMGIISNSAASSNYKSGCPGTRAAVTSECSRDWMYGEYFTKSASQWGLQPVVSFHMNTCFTCVYIFIPWHIWWRVPFPPGPFPSVLVQSPKCWVCWPEPLSMFPPCLYS